MTDPQAPKADGLNYAEIRMRAREASEGGWPGLWKKAKRKRAFYRALKRGDPQAICHKTFSSYMHTMTIEALRDLYGDPMNLPNLIPTREAIGLSKFLDNDANK